MKSLLIGTCALLLLPLLPLVHGFSIVCLSSFANLATPPFREFFQTYVNYGDDVRTLGYIGTAQYAFNPASVKSRGEQRRRARYEAKQKMNEIQLGLGLDGGEPVNIELDMEDFTQDKLREALMSCSVIYTDGGNTFYLQKVMRDISFWEIATPILKSSDRHYTYMGASAGGIVAGASVKTALFKGWDDPRAGGAIAEDYVWDDKSFAGANLMGEGSDYLIFPHFKDEENHAGLIASKLPILAPHEKVIAVGDHEAIIQRNGEAIMCFDSLNVGTAPLRVHSPPQ